MAIKVVYRFRLITFRVPPPYIYDYIVIIQNPFLQIIITVIIDKSCE
jgi:hypothetical protein